LIFLSSVLAIIPACDSFEVRCARVRVNRYRERGHTTYPDRTAGLLGERFFAFIEEILVSPQPDSLSW